LEHEYRSQDNLNNFIKKKKIAFNFI